MVRWSVRWEIDDDMAVSPLDAAVRARAAQTREGTIATVFEVEDRRSGEIWVVDLTYGTVERAEEVRK